MLIFYVRTKDLSNNLASLPLSMSNCVFIPAMLALKTRYLPSIFDTSSCITHADIQTCLLLIVAVKTLSTLFFFFCFLLRFQSKTSFFLILNLWLLQLKLLSHLTQLSYLLIDNTYCFHGVLIFCIPSIFFAEKTWYACHPRVFVGKFPVYTTFLPSWLI